MSDAANLVKSLIDLEDRKEHHEKEIKKYNEDIRSIKEKILEYLRVTEQDSLDITGVGKIFVKNIYSWKMPQGEDRERFINYLKEKKREDLLSVNHNTLNSYLKKELELAHENQELDINIPGIGEKTLYQSVSYRKKAE